MSEQQKHIQQLVIKEYKKCKEDPVYFMKKYCYIQHPQRGKIPFALYPFQEKVLYLFRDNANIITLKSRQLGISTLAAGYAIWLMTFHDDKNVLALATTAKTAMNIVTKVKYMYDNLPSWLKLKAIEKNKSTLTLSNGSRMTAKSSNPDAARSEAVSLLLIDEAAFIDNIEETFTAAQQTLATGGQCMALSTPNGIGNWFHQTWVKSEMGENSFTPIKLPWTVHPERDQTWRDKQDADLGKRMAAQECDGDFLSSGATAFELDDIDYYESMNMLDPLEKRGIEQNFWIWSYPTNREKYIVSADVARGDGEDFSTFHIVDTERLEQVAEFKGKLSPKEFGNLLVSVATEWNSALLVIENANIGWSTIEQVQELGYMNLYHSSPNDHLKDAETYMTQYENGKLTPGFTTSSRTRPLILAKYMEFIRERSVIIRSKRLIREMRTFVWKNGKAQAQKGYNDDLVMAFAIAMYVRDGSLRHQEQGLQMARAQMNSMYNTNNTRRQAQNNMGSQNPYTMEDSHGNSEDLSWLF